MDIKLEHNHISLQSANEINDICNPLKKLGISIFTYLKNFKNGERIYLSNNTRWVENYYNLKLYCSSLFEKEPDIYDSGFIVWPRVSNLEVFTHGRKYFDSDHGITIVQHQKDSCEFYFFSGSAKDKQEQRYNFYLNNLDLLERFIVYFKDKAANIITEANKHKIIMPEEFVNIRKINDKSSNHEREIRKEFIANTRIKHYRINNGIPEDITLSKREIDCISLLIQGKTAEIISETLFISRRTVEKHLENIRLKFNCSNKSELIEKFIHSVNLPLTEKLFHLSAINNLIYL